jgi:hypothetical protein
MHTMGDLDALMTLMSSGMPPRSEPPMPSTSSMITRRFSVRMPSAASARLSTTSASCCSMAFLPRVSLALSSRHSYCSVLAASVAIVVLPMPGGPLSSTALQEGPLCVNATFFVLCRCTASQSRSQLRRSFAVSWPPRTSSMLCGLY